MAELTTRVAAVTVYTDRARVTREGRAAVEVGACRLEIGELPLGIDGASVRAKARGTARARLLGVELRRRTYAETPVETVRALEQKLEQLGDQGAGLQAQLKLAGEERQAVRGLSGATDFYARGLARGTMKAADEVALLDALRQRAAELDQLELALAVRLRALGREQQLVTAQLAELKGARGRERYVATVELDVTQPGELVVELTYVLGGASWAPVYDLRLVEREGGAVLEVAYLTQVQQRTGEGWDGVELTLSTARPALGAQVPELQPWYLSPPLPRPGKPKMAPAPAPAAMGAGLDGFAASRAADLEIEVDEAAVEDVVATVASSGAAVTYRIPGEVAIPGDGASHRVTVARFELPATLDHVTAPKIIAAAYRRARAHNQSQLSLLPGDATLFDGDELVGTTRLPQTPPGGELELYLGVDERISVKRELRRRDVDRKLLGDGRRLGVGYEIVLESALPGPTRVRVEDQLPVARHESIKVKLEEADPRPSEQTELGLLRWELELAPHQRRTLRFDFQIEHPREMQVIGLP